MCVCLLCPKASHPIKQYSVPIIVVFTKLDVLHTQVMIEQRMAGVNREKLHAVVEKEVQVRITDLCVSPLRQAAPGSSYPHVAVSSG
jgi:translation initiation factor IF-2